MAFTLLGLKKWSMTRDAEGHRTYKATVMVQTNAPGIDGPAEALQTPGLPLEGDIWDVSGDVDVWAWFRSDATVTPEDTNRPSPIWFVEMTASTKPPAPDKRRCKDTRIEDPLLEPQKIGGSFENNKIEAVSDRFGNPVVSSSHEQLRGPQVEFNDPRPKVWVEQNVADLQLPLVASLFAHGGAVNDAPMWGLDAGMIHLCGFTWERKYYGSCYVYFTRKFEFEINYEGWDRDVLDEGTKALWGEFDGTTGNYVLMNIGGSPPNPHNPQHFKRFTDRAGNPCRVILDGSGLPAGVQVGTGSGIASGGPGSVHVEYYPDGNFLSLNLPLTLGP